MTKPLWAPWRLEYIAKADEEGECIFCEPSSAASLAGVRRAARAGRIDSQATVVCVLTGHGLKDPRTALDNAGAVVPCEPELAAVERAVLG